MYTDASRSYQELSKEYLVTAIGVDAAGRAQSLRPKNDENCVDVTEKVRQVTNEFRHNIGDAQNS